MKISSGRGKQELYNCWTHRLEFNVRAWMFGLVLVYVDINLRLAVVSLRLLEVEPAPPVADATGCDDQQQENDEQFFHGKLHGLAESRPTCPSPGHFDGTWHGGVLVAKAHI